MLRITTLSSMEKVLPRGAFKMPEERGEMLTNEIFAFQAVVVSRQNLMDAFLKVETDLPAEINPVGYMPGVFSYYPDHDGYILGEELTVFPDVLQQSDYGFISAGVNKAYWISVRGDKNKINPGKYPVKLMLMQNGEILCECTYLITVQPAALAENDLIVTRWMHYDAISDSTGFMPFEENYYKALRNYITAAAEKGHTMLYVPMFTPPLDTQIGGERQTVQCVGVTVVEGGGYKFDFTHFDKIIALAKECGMKYFELSHLFTQWGAKFCPKIIAQTPAGEQQIFGWENSSESPEYRAFLAEFLPVLTARLKALNIDKVSYLHISDEPYKEHLPQYLRHSAFIKKYAAGIKLFDALSDYEFFKQGGVDIPVVALGCEQEFIKNNAKIWVYYCCSQYKNNNSNAFFNMPVLRTRILGVQLYLTGVKGFLQWGFNFYNSMLSKYKINPYADASSGGYFPAGDAFIVYPEKDGTVNSSIRLEAFNFGIQDYRALCALEKRIGRAACVELINSFGIASNFSDYDKSEQNFINLRNRINELLI